VIKQLMYSNASEGLHTIHTQVMATIILFTVPISIGPSQIYKNQWTYGKCITNKEEHIPQKNVSDAYRLLSGWCNNYGRRNVCI